ncbi:shikimate dehydrogenase [Aquihabitans sp. McL0605]|uniref:shikimate dehydrogenase n=1 Tax=Aquihabitans sp. McL0605 TaxID=3415671 RepID=UPI003CF25302
MAAVIGSPVRHSRSPALANAAFAASGLDWAYVALEVAPGQGAAAVDAMRTLGLGGLSVTMPHKYDVIAALDRLAPDAEALGAVNCIAWDGDALVGHNTDGAGLLDALALDQGIVPEGLACVVLGAGGAARSVVRALGGGGAADVAVVNRTAERAEAAAALAGPAGRVGSIADVERADLVINATSVGMGADPADASATPVPPELLRPGQTVVDLVYLPLETPLLVAAAAAGARPVDGLGMLVHQAARAIALWTGQAPDVAAMAAAARA